MKLSLTASEVLEIIDPIDPDNLQSIGTSGTVWEAKWCPPILEMEIEVLKRTPRVHIVRDVYEPESLPGWAAVQFTVRLLHLAEGTKYGR